jgi:hypothetical protein
VIEALPVINALLGLALMLVALPAVWRLMRGVPKRLDILWVALGLGGLNRVIFNVSVMEGAALETVYAFAAVVAIIQIIVAVREQRR